MGMAHITGTDRAQVLLLPDTVDDCVGPDNPVRFIDAFVDSLDLAGAGFERAEPKETGCPGYDPSDLLKGLSKTLSEHISTNGLGSTSRRPQEVVPTH